MFTSMTTFKNNSSFFSKYHISHIWSMKNVYRESMKLLNTFSEANKKLQDTNDHIQGMVELPLGSSPMPNRRALHTGTPSPSDFANDGLGGELQKLEKMFR